MEKEFIPYEQALALKELGFDDETLKSYDTSVVVLDGKYLLDDWYDVNRVNTVKAPLYQQAFRWFREKYDLDSHIYLHETENGSKNDIYYEKKYYRYYIRKSFRSPFRLESENYKTSEEAELTCLKKLIEIVKNK